VLDLFIQIIHLFGKFINTHLAMNNRFLLFGEKTFHAYAQEKFAAISVNIGNMSDVEALMYKDHFYDLIVKTIKANAFQKLEVQFENQVVDIIGRRFQYETRYFAEYSLVVKGDMYFLGLTPYLSGYRPVDLLIDVRGNVMSFEIDTASPIEELSPASTAVVKKEYDRIKRYITNTLDNLNETIDHFNRELEKFVVPVLAEKMRKAERCLVIREKLNFK
jgi:hypothetical protein